MKKKYLKPVLNVSYGVLAEEITVVSLPQESVDNITVGSRKTNNRNWDDDDDDW